METALKAWSWGLLLLLIMSFVIFAGALWHAGSALQEGEVPTYALGVALKAFVMVQLAAELIRATPQLVELLCRLSWRW